MIDKVGDSLKWVRLVGQGHSRVRMDNPFQPYDGKLTFLSLQGCFRWI